MASRLIDQVRERAPEKFQEAVEKARETHVLKGGVNDEATKAIESGQMESLGGDAFDAAMGQEAIILADLRPAYFISNNTIDLQNETAADPALLKLIQDNKAMLERQAMGVGRVDLLHHRTLPYAGTGWLVDETIAVTNRHVARVFAEDSWNGYRFKEGRMGEDMEARIDSLRQFGTSGHNRAEVLEVLFIAGDREADIAFLRVRPLDGGTPLELSTKRTPNDHPVAVIGYPAKDGTRNDPDLMAKLFGDTDDHYGVKRFSPGFITGRRSGNILLTSDYTSLGGNSGSPMISLETGDAVGLHFAGLFGENNFCVASDIVAAAMARTMTMVSVPHELVAEAPTSDAGDFADRKGYAADFLGCSDLAVPLPALGGWASDIAPVSDDANGVLKYHHFSVIQSASRRLPLVTAVNIDGAQALKLKRKDKWRLDGRLAPEHQIGNELYRKNPLDRGHLVRRRDPGWGDTDRAKAAELDTFHYTNSAPQHKDLNQKDWVGLEDYIMEAAENRDFKISVFTGPVFRDDDKRLKHQPGAEDVQIPEEFWKVAVMVKDDGSLSATGYILSHGPMIRDMVETAFVLGEYRTYQVQIAKIEAETGLDFGTLRSHDPLGAELAAEAVFGTAAQAINGGDSLTLT